MTARHRFVEVRRAEAVAQSAGLLLCGWVFPGGAVRCALPYPTEYHYTDVDHPYVPSYGDDGVDKGCQWELQGAPLVGLCGKARYAMEHQTDHNSSEYPVIGKGDAAQTVTFEYPLMEPAGRMFGTPADAALPAEDGSGVGSAETWASEYRAVPFVGDAEEEPELPFWERAADALDRGDVVTSGPWPVRQFYWGAGELAYAVGEVTEALALIGEPFMVWTWWSDPLTQLIRVQWGELLGADSAAVVRSVREWGSSE